MWIDLSDLKVEDIEQEMVQLMTRKADDKEDEVIAGDDEKEPLEETSTKEEGKCML